MKVLGVTLGDDLNASTHITEILAECSRSMYALRILRSHGLYLQLPSMMLQELPPWLNLCMLLRLGGALPGLSTGHESTVSSVEHAEWGTSLVRPQKLQSWLVTLKMACWLPLLHVQPTFYDQFFHL